MRFIETPRSWKKTKHKLYQNAMAFMKMDTFNIEGEECEKKIYELNGLLGDTPDVQYATERTYYLQHIGIAYAHLLAGATGWKVGEIIYKEKDKTDDIFSVVSPEHKYSIAPLHLVLIAHKQERDLFTDLYDKIKSGNLPHSAPEKFLALVSCFYDKPARLFYPAEDDDKEKIMPIIHKSAELIDAKLNESGALINISVETAIQRIEKILLQDKEVFARTPENLYLAGFGALFGHLVKLGCGYEWGKAWFDEMCGVLVLYSPDKNYYMKPSKLIKRELLAKRNHCELLSLYHKIKNNALPPLESEGCPEEILQS